LRIDTLEHRGIELVTKCAHFRPELQADQRNCDEQHERDPKTAMATRLFLVEQVAGRPLLLFRANTQEGRSGNRGFSLERLPPTGFRI
jgi:hypothetical protein